MLLTSSLSGVLLCFHFVRLRGRGFGQSVLVVLLVVLVVAHFLLFFLVRIFLVLLVVLFIHFFLCLVLLVFGCFFGLCLARGEIFAS